VASTGASRSKLSCERIRNFALLCLGPPPHLGPSYEKWAEEPQ
jgi:hypothetical protein